MRRARACWLNKADGRPGMLTVRNVQDLLPPRRRHLLDPNRTSASPPDTQEPCSRFHHRRCARNAWNRSAPTVEPGAGGAWIDPGPTHPVLPAVEQDVDERVADFRRRSQRPAVVPIAPNATLPAQSTVDRLRDSDREAMHATHQLIRAFGLDEKMDVVHLDREVRQHEA